MLIFSLPAPPNYIHRHSSRTRRVQWKWTIALPSALCLLLGARGHAAWLRCFLTPQNTIAPVGGDQCRTGTSQSLRTGFTPFLHFWRSQVPHLSNGGVHLSFSRGCAEDQMGKNTLNLAAPWSLTYAELPDCYFLGRDTFTKSGWHCPHCVCCPACDVRGFGTCPTLSRKWVRP